MRTEILETACGIACFDACFFVRVRVYSLRALLKMVFYTGACAVMCVIFVIC